MAMGRWRGERQGTLFIETEKLARSEGRTFYSALSEILSGNGFDWFCEEKVAAEKVFDEQLGRPSIPPGLYFRMLHASMSVVQGLAGRKQPPCPLVQVRPNQRHLLLQLADVHHATEPYANEP